jgi:hypothetical protein
MLKNFLAAALFLSLAAALSLTAQAQGQTVGSDTKTKSFQHKICPGKVVLNVSATYPKDTGNAQVDQFFLKTALDYISQIGASSLEDGEVLTEDYLCDSDAELAAQITFEATYPSAGVLAVLNTYYESLGGAHPNHWFKSFNFDLGTGKDITVQDLFPDAQKGIAGVYALAYNDLCSKTSEHDPAEYVLGGTCGEDKSPPAELLALTGGLDGLGHLTLTPGGARLTFQADDIWSYAQGDHVLQIPAPAMLALGAHDYWAAAGAK